jgi:heptaprenyl diphosphate synthase
MKKRIKTQKLTLLALCISLAMIFSYIEIQLVADLPFRPGLSNIIIIWALYRLGFKDASIISFVRVFLVWLLFGYGRPERLVFSLVGAILSLLVMALLKKLNFLSSVGVSVAGAVIHNLAQILVAAFLFDTWAVGTMFIPLAITAIVSGIFIGLCGSFLVKRFNNILK